MTKKKTWKIFTKISFAGLHLNSQKDFNLILNVAFPTGAEATCAVNLVLFTEL